MSNLIKGTFAADGDTEVFVAKRFTILLGTTSGNDYGSGTVTLYLKQADDFDWTADSTYTTGNNVLTTIDYVGGIKAKLTLSGSTSPDLDYSIKYEA